MAEFIIASTIIFGLGAIIWNSNDWLNIGIKALFIGMMTWGIVWIVIIFSA